MQKAELVIRCKQQQSWSEHADSRAGQVMERAPFSQSTASSAYRCGWGGLAHGGWRAGDDRGWRRALGSGRGLGYRIGQAGTAGVGGGLEESAVVPCHQGSASARRHGQYITGSSLTPRARGHTAKALAELTAAACCAAFDTAIACAEAEDRELALLVADAKAADDAWEADVAWARACRVQPRAIREWQGVERE